MTDERRQTKSRRPRVLRQVAEGALIHKGEFMQTNAVVTLGAAGGTR